MLKHRDSRNEETKVKEYSLEQEIQEPAIISGTSRFIMLPVELQMKIIVFAQNPLIMTSCWHFYSLGQSTSLRVDYLLHRYGSNVLGERAMKRKIATPQVTEQLIRHHSCDPKADGDYWIFKQACEAQNYGLGQYIIESSLVYNTDREKILGHLCTIAAMKGSIPMIDMLVNKFHADIHQPNGEELPLTMAAQENQVDMVIHLYQTYGCNIHHHHERYLRSASLHGYERLVTFLLNSGSDVHAYNDAAIHNAVFKGNALIVKQLLEFGANAQANHNSCIRLAVNNGDLETVQYLITVGGVDPRFHHDWPLRHACRHGFDDIVKYLLDSIQLPDVVNLQNGILLESAIKYGRYSLVEMLLTEYDVNLNSSGMKRGVQHVLKSKTKNNRILKLLMRCGVQDLK